MEFNAEQIAFLVKGRIVGDKSVSVNDVAPVERAQVKQLSYICDEKYVSFLSTTQASIILVSESLYNGETSSATLIIVPNARIAISELLKGVSEMLNPKRKGIEPMSFVSDGVAIPDDAYVGAFAYIGRNVKLGKGVQIYPHCYIGDNVIIGDETILYSGVKIYYNCVIGRACIFHSGVVIGADGFGFEPDENHNNKKVPQIGNVIIGDEIEIGANSTVDRAMMGSTVVKNYTKVNNLTTIAHNVQVGENCLFSGHVGIAGSTVIGDRCVFAGQVGVADHLTIADDCVFGAKSGLASSVRKAGTYMGIPAIDANVWRRASICFKHLPEFFKQLNEKR